MPYVKSFDGTKIYYEILGEGIPLVLLPSCGVSLDVWKFQNPLAAKFFEGFEIILLENRHIRLPTIWKDYEASYIDCIAKKI